MRFINPDYMNCMPRSYRGTLPNGSPFRLLWDGCTVRWANYYASVVKFMQDNGAPVPSEEDVQDFMCRSAPQGCTADTSFHAQPNSHQPSFQPCSTCGKRF